MNTPAKILVVDDDSRNVKLLEALLELQGYQILTASGGDEALAILAREDVHLLLSDVMMPAMDGFELTKRLRQHARTRLLPIVLVTALRETEDRIKGIEAGCDDFISKPFDKHEVLARVKTLLTISYYRSLLDEKEKFDSIIDHIEDGIVVLDEALHPTRVSRRAAELLGIDPERPPLDLLSHVTRSFTIEYGGDLGTALRSEAISFDLMRPETETTRPLIVGVRSRVIRDPHGAISSIVLTLHDATEERTEEFLKQDFLSLISHKLRTPVAVINANAAVLRDGLLGPLSPEQHDVATTIVDKAIGLSELIGKLLEFTAILSHAPAPAESPIVLATHLPALLDSLTTPVKDKRISVHCQCLDPAATVRINRMYFDLIISNLLDNAVKFNDKDVVEIAVTVTRHLEALEIAIADNGRGIPPEEREHVFKQFYQVEKYFTGNVEGVGLGLALVKRLVTAHGGTIHVESEIGRGAVVRFTLPA